MKHWLQLPPGHCCPFGGFGLVPAYAYIPESAAIATALKTNFFIPSPFYTNYREA